MNLEKHIIEYEEHHQLKFAWVTEIHGTKLHIHNEKGKNAKCREKDVRIVHPLAASSREIESIKNEISDIKQDIDLKLIWDSLDPSKFMLNDLTEFYFNESKSVEESALYRSLLNDSRFTVNGLEITIRSQTDIDAEKERHRLRQEKDAIRGKFVKWARHISTSTEAIEILDDYLPLIKDLDKDFQDHQKTDLLKDITCNDRSDNPFEMIFDVLVAAGKRDYSSVNLLKIISRDSGFSESVKTHAEQVNYAYNDLREKLSDKLTFSIDAADTQEIDDAISYELIDSNYHIGVHIADLSCFVKKGDPVDEEALRRSSTVYLPTGNVLMIPESISCDKASLIAGMERPAFSILAVFNSKFELIESKITRTLINVDHRLSYDESDAILEDTSSELHEALSCLDAISKKMQKERLQHGAIVIAKDESKLYVHDDTINCQVINTHLKSRMIIGEFMILANHLTALLARDEEIPIIYRGQDTPDEPARHSMGKILDGKNPRKMMGMKKSQLSLHPKKHSALGIKAYTQISSPLRRFSDLVLQRQICAWMENQPAPYTTTEIMEILGNSGAADKENRGLDSRSNRYWTLEYLKRNHHHADLEAIAASKYPSFYLMNIQPWNIRAKLVTDRMLKFGDSFPVKILRINPVRGVLELILD